MSASVGGVSIDLYKGHRTPLDKGERRLSVDLRSLDASQPVGVGLGDQPIAEPANALESLLELSVGVDGHPVVRSK